MAEACCTCTTLLSNVTPLYDEKTEKPVAQDRRLECCGRIICGNCIHKNHRFGTYCPFCQISNQPTPLPQGLRSPPSYVPSRDAAPPSYTEDLPTYNSLPPLIPPAEKRLETLDSKPAEDVLHFLDHSKDTLTSLSLRYKVPINALRRVNGLTSDYLLLARRTILIPGEYYKGRVSLSPRPVEGEEEEIRKSKIRRWMVSCKVSDYDVALLYLKQTDYDLEAAIEIYEDDERWEKEHPINGAAKGKGKRYDLGKRRFTGQRP